MNMNTTNEYFLSQINSYSNKKHWRCRNFISNVEMQVSDFRMTAIMFRGTFISQFCNHEANKLERELHWALEGTYRG